MSVDYKALYFAMQQQNGDLSLMVDKYQREIIPQYEQLLKAARAERDDNAKALIELSQTHAAALEQLKRLTACYSCKHKQENCDSQRCHGGYKLWEWAGPQEVYT